MYIITNTDFLVVETTQQPKEYAYYVTQSLTIKEVEIDYDCTGQIFINDLFIAQPTPYHTASKGNWILTEENALLLSQVIMMTCSRILKLCAFGINDSFMDSINSIALCKNRAKAYIRLKHLLNNAPQYINTQNIILE